MGHSKFAMAVLLATWCARGFAWEADVHYGLTKWMALEVGFKTNAAQAIADANQDMDASVLDAINLMLHYACLGKDKVSSEKIRDHHFPVAAAVGRPPKDREVKPGGKAAFHLAEVVFSNPRGIDIDLRDFGFALHSAQDSWSHQGVPDVPSVLGLVHCDEGYAWAHGKKRGGWAEHSADITYRWHADTVAAAKATYDLMLRFLAKYPNLRDKPTRNWSSIEPEVVEFQKAVTKTDKKNWFTKTKITDVDFLFEISIPDGKESFRSINSTWRKGRDAVVRKLAINVPQEVNLFFASFLIDWARTRNTQTLVAQYVDANKVAARMGLGTLSETERRDSVAYSFRQWKVGDHGSAAASGHGPSGDPSIRREQIRQLDNTGPLVSYDTLTSAYLARPPGDDGPPYVIFPGKADGTAYVAAAKFRHAPYDVLLVTAEKDGSKWRITGLNWHPDH